MTPTHYDGNVTPGGAPQVRELSTATILKVAVDEKMSNNAYLLTCRSTGSQILVDAAADAEVLMALVDSERLEAVVTTHQHWDHHRALPDVVARTNAAVLVGASDADAVTEQTGVSVTRRLAHGDVVACGRVTLEVIALQGHTPGSVALVLHDPVDGVHLFTGDSLFPGGPGRTTGDEAFDSLMTDLQRRVFDRFPDDTWFYPGHGTDSTLGAERGSIPEWLERRW